MTDSPLPPRANQYIVEHHDATPDELLRETGLLEPRREQVEHLCAVSRYAYFCDREENDDEGLRFNRVEWADVADWDVSSKE